jgi:hypothetical protein
MPATADRRETMSAPLDRAVQTNADNQSPISPTPTGIVRQGWQHVITDILLSWLRDPKQLEDDGIEPPTGTIIRLALDYAEQYRDSRFPAPDTVTVDPNGGIVFQSRDGRVLEEMHIWDDGTAEYMRFEGATLVLRLPLPSVN